MSEGALDLVRRLKLPNFLLANTHAKRIATQIAQYDDKSEIDQEMETASTAKWLRLYQRIDKAANASFLRLCKSEPVVPLPNDETKETDSKKQIKD